MKIKLFGAVVLALSLALCAFALGGCELFHELFFEEDPPPRLVIKNESLGFANITKIEFWEETPAAREAAEKMTLALVKMSLDIQNFPARLAEFTLAVIEYEKASYEVLQQPPLLTYSTVISYGDSRTFDLDPDKGYTVRVNDGKACPVYLKDKGDTVYVFDGKYLAEE
jgi:hypothetical protein